MKITVSIEAIGRYLSALVGAYNDEHGDVPTDLREYSSGVPSMLAHLTQWKDAPFVRAALIQLVWKNGLTEEASKRLCDRAQLLLHPDELRPILAFMLEQVEKGLKLPPVRNDIDVEFVSTGEDPRAWVAQREILNPGLSWDQPATPQRTEARQPCPRSGFWFTPALIGSRRYFKQGDVMPDLKADYGTTFWQWDPNQDPPKLG